jgi:septin family protein
VGFGTEIDTSWDPIIKYIKDQHSAYLRKELTAMRDRFIQDTRIHCCLYFISPTGHSLRPIDMIVMKKLSEVVNVVPVIAKADSLSLEERDMFKMRVRIYGQYLGSCWDTVSRFGRSWCTTTSASTPSTPMRMTRRRCS